MSELVCNITKSRMEQGSRCFALRIVISITSLLVRKKGEPTRENHVCANNCLAPGLGRRHVVPGI